MARIWVLITEDEEEQNFSLFWNKTDIAEVIPALIGEMFDEEDVDDLSEQIGKFAEAGDVEKMIKYIEAHTELQLDLIHADVEGTLDAATYQRLGKSVKGPRLVQQQPERPKPRKQKARTRAAKAKFNTGEIPLYVDNVRVG